MQELLEGLPDTYKVSDARLNIFNGKKNETLI